jgi:AAA domain
MTYHHEAFGEGEAWFKDGGEQEQPNGKATPLPFTLLRDLKPSLDRRELIKGAIPAGGFGVAYAEPGAGKTAIIVDMGLHVAAGREYRDRRVEQQPVIYVALEGHGGIGNRIIAAAAELSIEDAPFALILASDNFRDPATSRRVAGVAKQLGGQPLVVIDTYTAALAGGSDCDPKDVGALIEAVKAELMMQGCTALLIHHSGKEQSRGARGWSGLLAACDFEFELSRDADLRTLRVSKMRDGSDSQPAFCYRLYGVELGHDRHGDPVTAVCVEHLADEDTAQPKKQHTPKARSALDVLWTMIKDPLQSFPLPEDKRLKCVLVAKWEAACVEPGAITNCKNERDRRLRFKAAKDELEAKGAIICDGHDSGRVYPAPKRERDGEQP